jgi:transposase
VPVPSEKERERRKVLASYSREVKGRTRYINLLYALFVHKGHTTIVRKNLATCASRQEAVKQLSGVELEEALWILKHLQLHESRIKELKEKIKQEAKEDSDMQNVQSIAGVGVLGAYAFVAYVGDASRFSSDKQVSNYLGFVPRRDYSGIYTGKGI